MEQIHYKSGYKFQLWSQYSVQLERISFEAINTDYVSITNYGVLILRKAFAWNGANKPAINTKNSRRATAIHDALYQLIALGLLPPSYRKQADLEMYKALREDKMSYLRAKWWYRGVRVGGGPSIKAKNLRKVQVAP